MRLRSRLGEQAAARGFRLLGARGREMEAEMAFAIVGQLLELPVLAATGTALRQLLAGPASAGAGALRLAGGAAPESEFAALHGLYWLCVNLAGSTPLLLTVDDLQWVDAPSLAWLAYFGGRTGGFRRCPRSACAKQIRGPTSPRSPAWSAIPRCTTSCCRRCGSQS
jgi:hypothetical protein